ncbi:MAG TPA: dihydroorotate dehydrogenase electron transfer subunit [Terriglobia bacterium]|nr:dihydroorotate dehydrogenase electron transfer subunit [Terriglobia bacterium]
MYDEVATVIENRPLTGGHFVLSVRAPRQARAARPGQFAMIRLLGHSDVLLRRPMSIYDVRPDSRAGARNPSRSMKGRASPPMQKRRPLALLDFLYKVVGRGTELMAGLEPGDAVGLLGPLGHGFFAEDYLGEARQADEVLHVAGGIGIAALLLPARELARAGLRQRLFFGGRTRADLVGLEEFRPYVTAPALATENGSRGHCGYVTGPLGEFLRRGEGKRFLILACGPWAMLEATVALAHRYGHRCLVSMENRMGCALGVCLGCSIRVEGEGHGAYERVCTEGPVFWAEHVVWGGDRLPKT